jgi:universal stress protein E
VKDPKPYQHPIIVAALDPLHRHAKPADLDSTLCALAETFSRALEGGWHALHASAGTAGVVFERVSGRAVATPALGAQRAKAQAALDRLLAAVSLKPETVQLQDLPPAQAIIETSSELQAAVVIMGAVSRRGLKRLLIGNTAEQVIDKLRCDLLVAKPKGFGIHFPRRARGPQMLSMALTPPLR